jgi:deoxyribodipyrimidine photo-lyase
MHKVFAKGSSIEEKRTEKAVQKHYKLRCELETFSTSTLYHAEDLLPKIFQMFYAV